MKPPPKSILKHLLIRIPIGPTVGVLCLCVALYILSEKTERTIAGQLLTALYGAALLVLRRPSHEVLGTGIALLAAVPVLALVFPYGGPSDAFSVYAFVGLFFGLLAAILEALAPGTSRLNRWLPQKQVGKSKSFLKKFSKTIAKSGKDM